MPSNPSNGSGDAVCGSLPLGAVWSVCVVLLVLVWSCVVLEVLGFEVWSAVEGVACWLVVAWLDVLDDGWLGVCATAMPTANTISTVRINKRVLMSSFS